MTALGHNQAVDCGGSRLESGPAASLTLHFLIAVFEQTFAFAILAFRFRFARVLLHVFSIPIWQATGFRTAVYPTVQKGTELGPLNLCTFTAES